MAPIFKFCGTIDMGNGIKIKYPVWYYFKNERKIISQSDPVCMYKYVYRGTIWLELKKGVGKY